MITINVKRACKALWKECFKSFYIFSGSIQNYRCYGTAGDSRCLDVYHTAVPPELACLSWIFREEVKSSLKQMISRRRKLLETMSQLTNQPESKFSSQGNLFTGHTSDPIDTWRIKVGTETRLGNNKQFSKDTTAHVFMCTHCSVGCQVVVLHDMPRLNDRW